MGRNPPSLKLRQQNVPQVSKKEIRKENKKTHQALNTKSKKEQDNGSLIYPGGDTAFKALLSARFCAAIWSHVTDCDETYNYWEPTHFLVFGKGLQTWEYSPEFALRSYHYLMLHAAPAFLYHKLLQPNPLLIFYFIRCLLGLVCSFTEVYFYKAICREFGVHIGRICLAFQLFSAGMFISSSAFLPSSFAMYAAAAACAAWWMQKYGLAVFMTALGSLLGWPFAALLGLPIAYDMIVKQRMYLCFAKWSAVSAAVILIPTIAVDSRHYGKLVVAPWNIVRYNVMGGGSELYGTEPWWFYLVNGFLNFNFIWVFALLTPIALTLAYFFVPSKSKSTLRLPHYISIASLYLWLAIMMLQPHKEERFLYPVYPMICLCGAITVDIIQKLTFRIWGLLKTVPHGTHYLDWTAFIMIGTILLTSLIGISRIFSLYRNYHAPLDLLMELNRYPAEKKVSETAIVNVCMAKDWHRYPSSFFLPNKHWNIRFVRSEFKGILPIPYTQSGNGTEIIHSHFNAQNLEEPSAYFDVNKCHFMLDLDLGQETELEPIYARNTDRWKVVKYLNFLNAERSHAFFRAFYIPFLTDNFVQFGNFSLLQTVKTMKIK